MYFTFASTLANVGKCMQDDRSPACRVWKRMACLFSTLFSIYSSVVWSFRSVISFALIRQAYSVHVAWRDANVHTREKRTTVNS